MAKSNVNNKVFSIPKSILVTAQTLEFLSPKLATDFAFKLFSTPFKFPRPKREQKMFEKAIREKLYIPVLQKEIQLYHCGTSDKKVLLIHGWAGRGTQLHAIGETFAEKGFHTISFDATAHGESQGKTSNMKEFIHSIHEIDKVLGPFEFAIGHSLGSMALLNAVKEGFRVKKIAIMGSGDSVDDICHSFVKRLGMKPVMGEKLKKKLDHLLGNDAETLSAYVAAQSVKIPVMVVHDTEDDDVDVSCAYHISNNLEHHELVITKGLGHRKILLDKSVIEKLLGFLT